MLNIKNISRQALIITEGWTVTYNSFFDLEPDGNLEIEGVFNNDGWMLFDSSLLQVTNERKNITLDLGWYPPVDPEGQFGLQLIKNTDWQNPLVSLDSKSKDEIVEKINELLWKVTIGEIK